MKKTQSAVWGICLFCLAVRGVHGAEMAFVPVSASGAHTIIGNEIILEGGGQKVFLEIRMSDWAPTEVRAYEATLDSSGFSSGLTGVLTPTLIACTTAADCLAAFGGFCTLTDEPCFQTSDCEFPQFGEVCDGPVPACEFPSPPEPAEFCAPAFVHEFRSDYVFRDVDSFEPIVDLSTADFRWASLTTGGSVPDPGFALYGGTLALDVPVGAMGTFVIELLPEPGSVLIDPNGFPIAPLNLTEARITVRCQSNADCDDDNACTSDVCTPEGTCINEPNFDDETFCCNPADGTLTPISDENECTEDLCNPEDGTVSHPPLPESEPCGDPTETECNAPDTCDGAGTCLDNLADPETPCGDPFDTECDEPDSCDDAGICQPNFVEAGTGCGDPSDTECTDPDACDGAGTCQLNHALDGTPCSSGFFCIVDESCSEGLCTGGTDRDCSDGLDCTDDSCNEDEGQCDNDIQPGHCVIEDLCRDDGDFNPNNDCEDCNPDVDPFDWSFRPDGSLCDDGNPCTGTGREDIGFDTCDGAGTCAGVLDPLCNDDCEFAVEVSEGTHTGFTNENMTTDSQASCQPDSNNDVWFVYTASCTGEVFVSTTGSELSPSNDPVLSIWDACPNDDGVEIACDDDSGVDLQAALVFNAVAGANYWIRIAGFEDNTGSLALNISTVEDCVIDGLCFSSGAVNPLNECEECIPELSSMSWSPRLEGTLCGDPNEDDCDNPDACDGLGACEQNFKPDGTECTGDGNECTFDFCLSGECSHPPVEAETPCGDPTDTECNNPDTCDGAGVCLDNFEPLDTPCGDPGEDQCDKPDRCDGEGFCDANLEPDGTLCDDGDICTGDDQCSVGVCGGTPLPQAPLVTAFGPRRIAVTATPPGSPAPVALLLTSPDWPCLELYLNPDGSFTTTPVFQLPDDWGTVFVEGIEIAPSSRYDVAAECGAFLSPVGSAQTSLWGDVVGTFDGKQWTPPDGLVVLDDIVAIIDRFLGKPTAPPIPQVDIAPCEPDGLITIFDIVSDVDAFLGKPYPCPLPCP